MSETRTDSAPEAPAPAEVDPRLLVEQEGLRGYATATLRRVRNGELGALPVVIGVLIIWTYFDIQNGRFLSAQNLSNLMLQLVSTGLIALGVVFVLLLGEIDLSVGVVSGLTGSVLAVLNVGHHWGAVAAIIAALVVGAAIGLFQGSVFIRFGVPSFVVTLAGLIAWQGVQLRVLGEKGTINLDFNGGVAKITNTYLTNASGWLIGIILAVLFVGGQLYEHRQRTRNALRPRPVTEIAVRSVVVAACILVAVLVLNRYRGVPLAVVIFVAFVVVYDLVIRRTRYGRHILAVGGNAEAARRAGISVDGIRLSVFVLASTMAAVGGVFAASRAISVTQSSGGSDVLLNVIAAAVIGGTSLFGGRGSAYSALLGMLVIQSISNGLDLLGESAPTKFIITGAVLLLAAIVDAVARRGRQAAGR
jgi:D-xylose transport system permease protein